MFKCQYLNECGNYKTDFLQKNEFFILLRHNLIRNLTENEDPERFFNNTVY